MSRIHPAECWTVIRDVILRNTPARAGNTATAVRGLVFHRQDAADKTAPHIFAPVIILVAQGAKLVRVGDEERLFGENICFVCVANMPVFCSVANASPERPYLALSLSLDTGLIATLAAELPPPGGPASELRAATACEVEPELLDAFARLAETAEHPALAPLLGASLTREIHCRLLLGPFGRALRELGGGGPGERILEALAWLKDNYETPRPVAELARRAGMAPSTFHKYFKEITAMSPLQYQKRLRLDAARRLLLSGRDVSGAALEVGYESATQFSREYKRLFGEPPHRDIMRRKRSGE